MNKVVSFLVVMLIVLITSVAFKTVSAIDVPVVTEGTIVEKNFKAKHPITSTSVVISGKVLVPVTNTIYVPDKWKITIEGINPKTKETESRTVKVTKEEYEKLNEGDYYVIPE